MSENLELQTSNGNNQSNDQLIDITDEFDELAKSSQNKPGCFGGCSEIIKKQNWLEELMNSSEKSGKNISSIANEVATDAVFAKLEFFSGKTLFHVSFKKEQNNRWENSGHDLVDLFDENKPGGERKHRYEQLKRDMTGAKVGMVFSEPTITDNLNYVHVFVDIGKSVEEYIVQYQGTKEDFSNLYTLFSKTADNANSVVDFNTPLRFTQDVPLDSFVGVIEESYTSDENKEHARDYLSRLNRDMADLPKIDDYQQEAQQLADYLEQQMLSKGISHGLLNLLAGDLDAYAKGSESVEDLTRNNSTEPTIIDVYENIQNKTNEIAATYGADSNLVMKSVQIVLDILDGKHGEFVRALLSSESKADIAQSSSLEARWIQIAIKELNMSEKEAQFLEISVFKLHEMFKEQSQAIDFVYSMDVAHGAVFFALDSMSISNPLQFVGDQTLSDETIVSIAELATSREQHAETGSLELITHLIQKEKDFIFTPFFQEQAKDHSINIQKLLPDGVDVGVLVRTLNFISHIDILPSSEKEAAIIQEKEKTLMEIAFLWDYLTQMFEHEDSQENPQETAVVIHSPRELIPVIGISEVKVKQEKEQVENFSLALIVWMIIRMSGYYSNIEFVYSLATKQDQNSLEQLIQKERPARLIQREPSVWLLLSIIWYLAMMREAGTQSNPVPPAQKKKIRKEVVIYAYTS